MSGIDRLDIDLIESTLETRVVGGGVLLFQSTASTNDIAWEYASNPANNGLCVFAEQQNAGRGRRGNRWHSGPGQSILCSILLTGMDCPVELLTLVAAVAAAEAIRGCAGLEARIKWPNDILIDDRKIAGILIESRKGQKGSDYVVGFGINCHQDKGFFDAVDLQMPATSIDIEVTGRLDGPGVVDRNRLAAGLIVQFDDELARAQAGGADAIVDQWRQLSSQLGKHVVLECDQRRFGGNCVGIDPLEGLVVQLDTGGMRMFHAAHTTIIKSID